jgi:hypothetical protein
MSIAPARGLRPAPWGRAPGPKTSSAWNSPGAVGVAVSPGGVSVVEGVVSEAPVTAVDLTRGPDRSVGGGSWAGALSAYINPGWSARRNTTLASAPIQSSVHADAVTVPTHCVTKAVHEASRALDVSEHERHVPRRQATPCMLHFLHHPRQACRCRRRCLLMPRTSPCARPHDSSRTRHPPL